MRTIPTCIAIVVLTLSVAVQMSAQSGLKVTGTVVSVKARTYTEIRSSRKDPKVKPDPVTDTEWPERPLPKPGQLYFDVELYLQFRNETQRPIIIFDPDDFYGERKMMFVSESKSSTVRAFKWRSLYNRKPDLDAIAPSPYGFVVIPSEGYYECRDTFALTEGYNVDNPKGLRGDELARLPVTSKHSSFRLKFAWAPKDTTPLTKAKDRWSEVGELYLTSGGSYSVATEPIVNTLP